MLGFSTSVRPPVLWALGATLTALAFVGGFTIRRAVREPAVAVERVVVAGPARSSRPADEDSLPPVTGEEVPPISPDDLAVDKPPVRHPARPRSERTAPPVPAQAEGREGEEGQPQEEGERGSEAGDHRVTAPARPGTGREAGEPADDESIAEPGEGAPQDGAPRADSETLKLIESSLARERGRPADGGQRPSAEGETE